MGQHQRSILTYNNFSLVVLGNELHQTSRCRSVGTSRPLVEQPVQGIVLSNTVAKQSV